MRRAARRDAVEPCIVTALERFGYAVARVSDCGHPDLVVSKHSRVWLLECKDTKAPRRSWAETRWSDCPMPIPDILTPAQAEWWRKWIAAGGVPPVIVTCVDEALEAVGARTV